MPIVDENRILGNYGTNLIAHLLSPICLVRHVAEGTDVGVDLYCEIVEEREPFLHFWAQVKCGKQIRVTEGGKATCQFKADHLHYWNRQPVPVFAFYVATDYPPKRPEQIFVANISEHLIKFGIQQGDSKAIESDFTIDLKSDVWQNDFLLRLQMTTQHLKFRDDGIISYLPELRRGYIIQSSTPFNVVKHVKKSLLTIRLTVSTLVREAALSKHHHSKDPPMNYFKRLVQILEIFEEGKRPEIMKASGLWAAIIEGDTKKAKECVAIAIESIDNDPNLNDSSRHAWREEFVPITQLINNLENKQDK